MGKRETATQEVLRDITFYIGVSKAFDDDFYKVKEILSLPEITYREAVNLMFIYKPSWHTSAKIEGAMSFDSSCRGCKFCDAMKKCGEQDPSIICNYCYDERQEERWINTENRHKLNMLIMMSVEFTESELGLLPVSGINRINSSGDCPNETYVANMFRLANANRNQKFALWTKNTGVVQRVCRIIGKPDNMVLVKSSIRVGKPEDLPEFFDYVFTVYATEEDAMDAIRNGAAECNGRKCRDCGWKCYKGTHERINIAEVIRVSKSQRDMIVRRG